MGVADVGTGPGGADGADDSGDPVGAELDGAADVHRVGTALGVAVLGDGVGDGVGGDVAGERVESLVGSEVVGSEVVGSEAVGAAVVGATVGAGASAVAVVTRTTPIRPVHAGFSQMARLLDLVLPTAAPIVLNAARPRASRKKHPRG